MSEFVFSRTDDQLGEFALRQVDPPSDAPLLHRWLTHPKSVFWMLQDANPDDIERQFSEIDAAPSHDAFVGFHNGHPVFLVERYDPAHDPVGGVHRVEPGDVGMHFLVAPSEERIPGLTRAVLVTVMDFLFSDPSVRRVVVEPDVGNRAVHSLNAAVGFRTVGTVSLPVKDALLSLCTRDDYERAREAATGTLGTSR